jgi:hypothetical protein
MIGGHASVYALRAAPDKVALPPYACVVTLLCPASAGVRVNRWAGIFEKQRDKASTIAACVMIASRTTLLGLSANIAGWITIRGDLPMADHRWPIVAAFGQNC